MGAGASSILVYSSQNKKLNDNLSTVQDCDQFTPEELASPLFDQSSFKNLKNLYVYGAYTNQSQEFSTELVKVPKTLTVDDWCSNVITGNGNSFLPFGIEAVESNLFTLAFIVFGLAAIPYFNKHNNFLWFMNGFALLVFQHHCTSKNCACAGTRKNIHPSWNIQIRINIFKNTV